MVGPSIGNVHEPCKSGPTDQHAIWGGDSVGPRNHVLDGGPRSSKGKKQFFKKGETGDPS